MIIYKIEIFWNFYSFPNCKFVEFFKLDIFGFLQLGSPLNFPIWKINKFAEFFLFGKTEFGSKNWQIL